MKRLKFLAASALVVLGTAVFASAAPTAAEATDKAAQEVESGVQAELSAVQTGTCGINLTWTLDEAGTLTIIGTGDMNNTFKGNINIKNVILGDGVTSIAKNAFQDCVGLISVTIPDSVTSIGAEAFSGCLVLREIAIPDGVTAINTKTFYNCVGMRTIDLGTGVTTINTSAFEKCSGLRTLVIPDSVTSIGEKAFSECTNIIDISFGSELKTIGNKAFAYCESLIELIIPDNVITLSNDAFYNCSSLRTVVLGEGVTIIPEWCFFCCSNLTSITFGHYLTIIKSLAFYNCKSLTTVNYYGTEEDWSYVIIDGDNSGIINAQKIFLTNTTKPQSVVLNITNATLGVGENLTLKADVKPADASNKHVYWTTSNNTVATVVGGVVTAKKAGVATITATAEDGGVKATCTITVKDSVEIPPETVAYFTFSDATARPDSEFSVTISLQNTAEINSIAIRDFLWDKENFEFVRFEEGTMLESALFKTFDAVNGTLIVGYENTDVYSGDVGKIILRAKENAVEGDSEITATAIVKNNNIAIGAAVLSGKVTVRNQMTGDINLDEVLDIRDAILLFKHSMMPDLYPIGYTGNIDFDKNDSLDILDAILIFQHSMMPDTYPLD